MEYSFHQGVKLTVLTNGVKWEFYLAMQEGKWETRKFHTTDIKQADFSQSVIDFISKDSIRTGRAIQKAEELQKNKTRKKIVKETLPKVNDIIEFLKTINVRPMVTLPSTTPPVTPPPTGGNKITQAQLIPEIIRLLQRHNGRASKGTIKQELYQQFKDIFDQESYQRLYNGMPKWKYDIEWAITQSRGSGQEYLKRPAESGRNWLELTEKGREYKYNV